MCAKKGLTDLGLWFGLLLGAFKEMSTPTLFSTPITLWSSSIKPIVSSYFSSLQCLICWCSLQFSAFYLVMYFCTFLSRSSISALSCLLTSCMVYLVASSTAFFSDLSLYCSCLAPMNSAFSSIIFFSRSSTILFIPCGWMVPALVGVLVGLIWCWGKEFYGC